MKADCTIPPVAPKEVPMRLTRSVAMTAAASELANSPILLLRPKRPGRYASCSRCR